MAVNKVIYGNNTLIDLTADTVTSNNLLNGVTAHDKSGQAITGSVITHNVIDNLNSTSTQDALSANQGRILDSKIKVKILEMNSPISESYLLNTVLTQNEGYECSGFFYNTNQNVYCEFEGLYSGHTISGETIHFGYCHIKGIHQSSYAVDYFIDDEDGSTWYKRTPNDYITWIDV